jgi:pimeloyl-ACP methyl ester carboxylesterase
MPGYAPRPSESKSRTRADKNSSRSPEPSLKEKKSSRSLKFSKDKEHHNRPASSRSASIPVFDDPPAYDLKLPPSPSFSFKSLRKRNKDPLPRPSLPDFPPAEPDFPLDQDRPPSVDTTELFAGPRTSFMLDPVDGTVHASNGLSVNTMDALVDQFSGSSNSWPRSKVRERKKARDEARRLLRPSTGGESSLSDAPPPVAEPVRLPKSRSTPATFASPAHEPSFLAADETSFLSEAVSYGDARDGPSWRPPIPSIEDIVRTHSDKTKAKSSAPSIDEIIRRHASRTGSSSSPRPGAKSAPPSIVARGRPSINANSFSFSDLAAHKEDDAEEIVPRTSVDSIAEEIARSITLESEAARQRTLRPSRSSRTLPHSRSQPALRRTITNDSQSSHNLRLSPPQSSHYESLSSHELEIAQYLRSPRLTRLITLKRPPNQRLTVSVADVGSATGHPVIVFLGLGCVRYLVALYDEMAEALGLRLVCLDRWGLGRTGEVPDSKRGFLEWSSVVEEVADTLRLGEEFSVLAHSAGAPYALASCLRMPERVKGSVHLLAPWVSTSVEGSGSAYKWLKFVPNGVLRTAQQAEWRMQAWKLGKPPTVPLHGVGYDIRRAPVENSDDDDGSSEYLGGADEEDYPEDYASTTTRDGRTPTVSLISGSYDHLDDLGRFSSSSFDAERGTVTSASSSRPHNGGGLKKKSSSSSSFFANLFGGSPKVQQQSLTSPSPSRTPSIRSPVLLPPSTRSSLRRPSLPSRAPSVAPPVSPRSPGAESIRSFSQPHITTTTTTVRREPSVRSWTSTSSRRYVSSPRSSFYSSQSGTTNGTSVISQSQSAAATPSPSLMAQFPPGPPPSMTTTTSSSSDGGSNKLDLGTALLKASHAESLKGATSDLLAILERTNKPWGFSYSDVPMSVKVWHGDRDERISVASVRWMERAMVDCRVRVVEGADHGLMTNTRVVVEALESIAEEAKAWRR